MRQIEKCHIARAFRIVSLPVLTFASLSCLEDGVAPNPLLRALPEVSATEPISGCARFSVHVELSSAAVTLQNGVTCGQLVPETDTTPVFDAARRALRLPIVLRNLSTSHVVAPARVNFTADSIVRYS